MKVGPGDVHRDNLPLEGHIRVDLDTPVIADPVWVAANITATHRREAVTSENKSLPAVDVDAVLRIAERLAGNPTIWSGEGDINYYRCRGCGAGRSWEPDQIDHERDCPAMALRAAFGMNGPVEHSFG